MEKRITKKMKKWKRARFLKYLYYSCWFPKGPRLLGEKIRERPKQTMEEKLSSVAKSLKPSPIQQLSYLAQRCNAINLAEGFPDFPAPSDIKDAAVSAINSDLNQYRYISYLSTAFFHNYHYFFFFFLGGYSSH